MQADRWDGVVSDHLILCLAVSFLQNSLQHVQVLGDTDVLLVRVENFAGILEF